MYFDSPKNKAMWEKEISRMETERERRRQNGFKPELKEEGEADKSSFGKISQYVRLITLEELERIVREKKGLSPKGQKKEMAGNVRQRESRVEERNGYELEAENENARYGAAAGRS